MKLTTQMFTSSMRSTTELQLLGFKSAIAKVRYRKSPRDTCRTVKLTLTLVLTLTDTGGAVLTLMLGYRNLYITWQYRLLR